jgi:hypothetical protein
MPAKTMKDQTTITVTGELSVRIRTLVEEFPGVNVNRVGRALVRMGLRHALRERDAFINELRCIDAPWSVSEEGRDDL